MCWAKGGKSVLGLSKFELIGFGGLEGADAGDGCVGWV